MADDPFRTAPFARCFARALEVAESCFGSCSWAAAPSGATNPAELLPAAGFFEPSVCVAAAPLSVGPRRFGPPLLRSLCTSRRLASRLLGVLPLLLPLFAALTDLLMIASRKLDV
ncbi:MAG: hypothetical protein QM775_05945 [Pirellulales bacterium]